MSAPGFNLLSIAPLRDLVFNIDVTISAPACHKEVYVLIKAVHPYYVSNHIYWDFWRIQ